MSLLRELHGILSPSQRRSVLAAQVLSLAMAFSTLTGIAAIAPFFAVLGNPGLVARNPLLHRLYAAGGFHGERAFVLALGGAFIAAVLLANLVNALGFLALSRIALRIGNELKVALFTEYLGRPYLFHARTHSASLFDRIVSECMRVSDGILQSGFVLITNIVTGSLIIASLLWVRPGISIAMLAGLSGGYLGIYVLVRKRLLSAGEAHSRASREQATVVSESLGGIREVLLLADRGLLSLRFARASAGVANAVWRIRAAGQVPKYVVECVAVAVLVGAALALAAGDATGGAWLGELTFVAFASYRLLPVLQQVFASLVKIRADSPALALIAPDLRAARARAASGTASSPRAVPAAAPRRRRLREGIRLESVWFRYSDGEPWVLRDVSLRIPAAGMIGLAGPNGSGKTTLLDVIAGLIVPQRGRVYVDGCLLCDGDRAAWQDRIAYVPQNVFLLDASIARNIAFGMDAGEIDRERLARAARLARLDELISALPDGYAHRIGERGIRLSGGQRQRIGIARALYREAAVVLLDEPASALDVAAEAELVDALRALRRDCAIVLVSHRPSAVQACDLVLELGCERTAGTGGNERLAVPLPPLGHPGSP